MDLFLPSFRPKSRAQADAKKLGLSPVRAAERARLSESNWPYGQQAKVGK
jgi:hypothetical protein